MTDAGAAEAPAKPGKKEWGRWFGRPGRSLTRRLIWLAAAWILVALLVTGVVLTSVFQESALRRLGNMLGDTIDEAVVAASITPEGEVFVGRLRKKIGSDRIETVRGLGYRLSPLAGESDAA